MNSRERAPVCPSPSSQLDAVRRSRTRIPTLLAATPTLTTRDCDDKVMRMATIRKQPFGPADLSDLETFEAQLPAALPPDYRAFLLEANGAQVEACDEFSEVPGGTCVETLFGLHEGHPHTRLDYVSEAVSDDLPETLLLIGSDPYGNYFALDLVDRVGAVLFIDHEALSTPAESCIEVAPSFSTLLARLPAEEAPPPPSPEEAAARGDAAALADFLNRGATGRSLVHLAVRGGNPAVLELVLKHDGDANERGGIGHETPLFVAAREGRADLARLLIKHGADVNARCDANGTALEMAEPWPDVFAALVRAGAEPSTPRLREQVRRTRGKT